MKRLINIFAISVIFSLSTAYGQTFNGFALYNSLQSRKTVRLVRGVGFCKGHTRPRGGIMKDLSVLVVDDEEGFVEALARRLDKRGFRISTATSAMNFNGLTLKIRIRWK